MAMLWADGADHYGNNATFQPQYFSNNEGAEITADPSRVRTGTHGIWLPVLDGNNFGGSTWGKNVGGARNVLGFGIGWKFNNYPSQECHGFVFKNANGSPSNGAQLNVTMSPSGELVARRGDIFGPVLGRSAPAAVVPETFQFIESKLFCDLVNGSIEVRVNGAVKLLITGVNTRGQGDANVTAIAFGKMANRDMTNSSPQSWDDFVIWDDSGEYNNDFTGDIRCRTMLPITDGPEQDWTSTEPNAFDAVDSIPFNPAKFISAENVGEVSNFGKAALPTNVAYIAAIQAFYIASKSDAGACQITPQLKNGAGLASGTPFNPGIGAGLYSAIFETDPATGNQFNRPGFDAAVMQVERTA